MILEGILPQYHESAKPSPEKNRLHVRYLFKVWDKLSGYQHKDLRKEISETPILWAYNGVQPESSDFVKPCDVYLSEAYTGNADLEAYFSMYNGDIWFVDPAYMEVDSNRKDWLQFLKAIKAMDTPRILEVEVPGSREECGKRGITYQYSTRPFEDGEFKVKPGRHHYDGHIVDYRLVVCQKY